MNEITEESREEGEEIPPSKLREVTEDEGRDTEEDSSQASSTQEDQRHPEWTPDTRYLRRKIAPESNTSSRGAGECPYALRSKSVRTQFQEERNESDSITLKAPQNSENLCTYNSEESHIDTDTPHTH
jgi:hypothetical protein